MVSSESPALDGECAKAADLTIEYPIANTFVHQREISSKRSNYFTQCPVESRAAAGDYRKQSETCPDYVSNEKSGPA
jgi:hypothetical protein